MDMYKMVLNDYRFQLKDAWKRAWNESFFIYLYMIIIPAATADYQGFYYLSMLPILIAAFIARGYAGKKNKTLFLCPLSEEQRREYYETAYRMRVGVSIGLFVVCAGSQVLVGAIHPTVFVMMLVAVVSYSFAINTWCPPVVNSKKAMERVWNLPGQYELWNIFVQASGILTMIILTAAAADEDKALTGGEWAITGIVVVFYCILAWKMVKKYYEPILEECIHYE